MLFPNHYLPVQATLACLGWPDGYEPGLYSDKYYLVETDLHQERLSTEICKQGGVTTKLAVYKTNNEALELVDLANGNSANKSHH